MLNEITNLSNPPLYKNMIIYINFQFNSDINEHPAEEMVLIFFPRQISFLPIHLHQNRHSSNLHSEPRV